MNLRRSLIASTALILLAACGGSSPFTVNGTIRGSSLKPGDAISEIGGVSIGSVPVNGAVVLLSNSSGLCASANARKEPKSSQFMTFVISDRTTSVTPTAGTYTIWPGSGAQPTKFAFAQYAQTDANCQPVQLVVANSGTITITSINNGDVSGNFDFTFSSGDHVTGSFAAKNCNSLISALGSSTCG